MYNTEKQNYKLSVFGPTFLLLVSFWGGMIYRIYSLNKAGVFISLLLSAVSLIIIHHYYDKNKNKPGDRHEHKKTKTNTLLTFFYFILIIAGFFVIVASRTSSAIISPWEVIPWYFFIIYGLATTALILNILKNSKYATILLSLHYFFSFSIAVIIYKIGYGFDSFVHEATMNLIDKTGSVDPKPFYYLSQYSLIIILHKLTFLPIAWLNKFLVPTVAALTIPVTIKKVFEKFFDEQGTISLVSLIVLAVPFSLFIVTVPQNLSYLLLIIVILLGLTRENTFDLIIIYLLSLVAILAQPIAGIPALFFAILLTAYRGESQVLKKYYYLVVFFLSTVSLPTIFYFLGGAHLELKNPINLSGVTIPDQENVILNFVYLYGFNIKTIVAVLSLAGIIIFYKHRKTINIFSLYLIMSTSLFLSYFITKQMNFSFLIDYERSGYADRLVIVATLFIAPFIITALYYFTRKLLKENLAIKIPILTFLVIAITTSLYLSYPRFDRYFNSRGYSTSQNDLNAVRWIDKNSDEDYIVLANQQVSAAALKEFGFKKYYKNDIFYYPIPTGGPLYQYYLDMVYKKPSKETVIKAMDLVGVNQAYFALNKYWWASPKILEEAKLEADSWQRIGKDDVYIFKYGR